MNNTLSEIISYEKKYTPHGIIDLIHSTLDMTIALHIFKYGYFFFLEK